MMTKLLMGLALVVGYVLGRLRRPKLAFALGTMIAGRRLRLSPKSLASFAAEQLAQHGNRPQ
ncbi:hypothetical protein [Streptomyces sp. NPDC002564]|uniref:hypothetical protein n=1 Tax=Streptomyces sp. NPDC002564 TaxID=3364649 RepID=UPI0036990513